MENIAMTTESNPVGRPPMYSAPEEMQEKVDEYFRNCELTWGTDKPKYPTVTGLALALGFNSRLSLINYEGKPEFVNTVKRAKALVEEFIEQRLYGGQTTGCIFNLKNNFGWRDSQDLNLGGQNGENPINLQVQFVD
jgi:hypothetical protein